MVVFSPCIKCIELIIIMEGLPEGSETEKNKHIKYVNLKLYKCIQFQWKEDMSVSCKNTNNFVFLKLILLLESLDMISLLNVSNLILIEASEAC